MFGNFKKEEVSPMTQPLLNPAPDEIGVTCPSEDDWMTDILKSMAETSAGFYENQNAGAGINPTGNYLYVGGHGLVPVGNGHVVASDNPSYVAENNDSYAGSQNGFDISYLKFPEQIIKIQRRQGGESHQRLRNSDAKVELAIKMHGVGQVVDMRAFVLRVNDPSFQLSDIILGPVPVETKVAQTAYGEYQLNLNLDSVYEFDGRKVFALAKNKTDEVNLFFLKIVVIFIDGSTTESNTKTFKVVGRAKEGTGNAPAVTRTYLPPPNVRGRFKRPRTNTDESSTSSGSSPSSGYLSRPVSSPEDYSNSPSQEDGLVKASRIAADYLEARNAEIGSLIIAEPIKTARGDIAYHFILKNPDDHPNFEEGEIVGLFVNESGIRVLDKLTQKNSLDAILKGVISHSYYLEAQTQPKGVRTETICMFGIVPVKTRGPVKRGDVLYASPDFPGVAVSCSNSGSIPFLGNDTAAIGMAWQTVSAYSDELNCVQCLVSITMEVFRGMFEKRIRSLKRTVDSDIEGIKLARKKSKKRVYICVASLATFLILLSILLWQLFMPMSAFRLWFCEKGCIKGHSASFRYIPTLHPYDIYSSKGKEFTFKNLKKKIQKSINPISGIGIRYFYNIERCANFGKSETDPILSRKSIGGPEIFALDRFCQHVFYYSGVKKKWCRYKSAKGVKCQPAGMKFPGKSNITDILPGFC